MQKSNTFSSRSEPIRGDSARYNRLEDFAAIENENDQLKKQIAEVERTFSLSN